MVEEIFLALDLYEDCSRLTKNPPDRFEVGAMSFNLSIETCNHQEASI